MNNHTKQAEKILEQGGIVIFPTDTAFGMGCRIDDEEAISKLFSIRKRSVSKAVPVLFDSIPLVEQYVGGIADDIQALMDQHWPGALTIVLQADLEVVPSLIRGGGLSIGTRIPAHDVPRELIKSLGVPIIGTSANFSGQPTPYTLADIDPQLHYLVDYIIPGLTTVQKESTVIDCTEEPWKVLRQGAVEL